MPGNLMIDLYYCSYTTSEKFYVEAVEAKILLIVDRLNQHIFTQGTFIFNNFIFISTMQMNIFLN